STATLSALCSTSPVLIDDLKAIQERFGYLPEAELAEYSERANVPLYRIEAVASFYPFFRRAAPPATEVRVCRDLPCHLAGGGALYPRLKALAAAKDGMKVGTCSCLGVCDRAPALLWNEHPISSAGWESGGVGEWENGTLGPSPHSPTPPLPHSPTPVS